VRVPPSEVGDPETFTSVPDVPIVVVKDELASCPLVIPAFVAKFVVVSPLKLVVATTPFMVPVSTPVEVAKDRTLLLIIEAVFVATPLTLSVRVFTDELKTVEVISAVLLAKPFTVEVSVLPLVVRLLVEAAVMALCRLVVARTPFTVDDSTTPEVLRAFELMILAVEVATPLTEVVIVLAADETWFAPMTELLVETPLIVVVRVLPDSV
jgi:hypothetical protein